MGIYVNSKKPFLMFQDDRRSRYFIDKSRILQELVPIVDYKMPSDALDCAYPSSSLKYLCITRPRRFGKTTTANLISAFFGKGADSSSLFEGLFASGCTWFHTHLNSHNVIHLSLNELPDECFSYAQYITRIKKRLLNDLIREFPDIPIEEADTLWDALNSICAYRTDGKFIFILDEWDFIFHRDFVTDHDKTAYLDFLNSLLKDQPYVELAYMTGILPIAKYSSGSALNMFCEYTMATEERFSEYFGFTDSEVDSLYDTYLSLTGSSAKITREDLRIWYDGYQTKSGSRVYNPRSVVLALTNNNLGNYWTSSGPYDEIIYYIKKNTDAVRDDLAMMVSGTPAAAKMQEYAAVSMELSTKHEIFSAMVIYGFLNYKDGFVSIPNKELMDQFAAMLSREPSLGYVYRLAKESERMLAATKALDTDKMAEILEYAHHTESPLLHYSNEAELTMIVAMVYLSARDSYRIEREDKAGIGYVDFIFYPLKADDDCIILELKAGGTPQTAIRQILERGYALKFQGRLGERPYYTGRILAVGISYEKGKSKHHRCQIKILSRENL